MYAQARYAMLHLGTCQLIDCATELVAQAGMAAPTAATACGMARRGDGRLNGEGIMETERRRKSFVPEVALVFTLSLFGALSCSTPEVSRARNLNVEAQEGVRGVITPDLAAQLTNDALFPVNQSALGQVAPSVSSTEATTRGQAWIAQHGEGIRPYFERQRGASISFSRLRACGRAFLVESAYAPLPENAPELVKRIAGAHWLIPFCDGGSETLTVSVAASDGASTNMGPDPRGANFYATAAIVGGHQPPIPEEVAADLSARTHRLISAVPALVSRGYGWAPQTAMWRFEIDAPTTVRETRGGATREAKVIYVRTGDFGRREYLVMSEVGSKESEAAPFASPVPLVRRADASGELIAVSLEAR